MIMSSRLDRILNTHPSNSIKSALLKIEDASYQQISAFLAQRDHKLRQMVVDPHKLNSKGTFLDLRPVLYQQQQTKAGRF